MDRANRSWVVWFGLVLLTGGALVPGEAAWGEGLIAYVEQAGKGSGDGPKSLLHIPRAGETYVDIWDRYTFDIFTMQADGSDVRRLTTDGLSVRPEWSWDGEWLAYVSGPEPLQTLYVVRADGSDRKALLEREQSIARFWWSLDSRQLLVAVESRHGSSARGGRRPESVLEGRVIDVRTGAEGRMSNNEWMRGWNHWEPGRDEVVNPRPRLMDALGDVAWPMWSPSGEFIAFLYDGMLALAHAPTLGDSGRWFLWNDEPFASSITEWSRDGRKVLFHGGSGAPTGTRDRANVGSRGNTGMLVAELDEKGYRWGDVYLVTTRQGGGGTFKGDGSRVTFLSTPPGQMNNEVYVVDVNGENEARITFSRVNHEGLAWQPVEDMEAEPTPE